MTTGAPETSPLRPLWLSHHYTCDADRCVRIGTWYACRRCVAMFAGFVPALALLLGGLRLQAGDIALVLGLAAVAGIEFVQVVRGQLPYRPGRVLVLSPPVGALLAWLGVTGLRDGLGPAHVALGLVALAVLATLFANGTVVRRTQTG